MDGSKHPSTADDLALPSDEQSTLLPSSSSSPSSPSSSSPRSVTPVFLGYVLILIGAIFQASRSFLYHVAEKFQSFPVRTTVFINSIFFTTFSITWLTYFHLWSELTIARSRPSLIAPLLVIGAMSTVCSMLAFVALATVPVGNFFSILALSPVATSVLAAVFLHDPFTLRDAAILAANVLGVCLVAQPTIAAGGNMAMGTFIAVLLSVSQASIFIVIRYVGTSVHYIVLALSVGVMGFLILPFMSVNDFQALANDTQGALVVCAAAALSCVTIVLYSRGMQVVRPGLGLVVGTFNVPTSICMGYALLGEPVTSKLLLGVALILSSISAIGFTQYRRSQAEAGNMN